MATTAALTVGQQVATGALFRQADRPSSAAGAGTYLYQHFVVLVLASIL